MQVVKKVILPEVSKLKHRDQIQFSPEEKTLEKGIWVCY